MSINTINIPQKEYEELVEARMRYYLRHTIASDIFSPPPTKNVGTVIKGFKKTGKYNQKFIESLQKGLSRSSYFFTAAK
mgnify:CR=1 FL=1